MAHLEKIITYQGLDGLVAATFALITTLLFKFSKWLLHVNPNCCLKNILIVELSARAFVKTCSYDL